MNTFRNLLPAFALCLASAAGAAEEPPDNPIAQQMVSDAGFGQSGADLSGDVGGLLNLKWAIQSARFNASNASIVKRTESFPSLPNLPGVDLYTEIITLVVGGEETKFPRELPPEEAQRREMEASGLNPQQLAQGLRLGAGGAMALGEGLRREMQGNAFGSMMMGALGFSDTVSGSTAASGMADADSCENTLMAISMRESMAASAAVGQPVVVEPWTSINPVTFLMGPACMMLRSAEIMEAVDQFDDAAKQQMADALEAALAEIAFAGWEQLNGRPTIRLRIDDLNMSQPIARAAPSQTDSLMPSRYAGDPVPEDTAPASPVPAVFVYGEDSPFDGPNLSPYVHRVQASAGTVTINSLDLWIDGEYLVDRKMRMEGVMVENGQAKDVYMESEFSDYRNVPDSELYEPYRRVMRAGGMMTDAQRAELAEAQQQLAEFERELANMPAAQRAMVERMMGPQMEQMRSMVDSGTFEIEQITTSIEINPDFRNAQYEALAREASGGGTRTAPAAAGNIVQVIQVNLTTLGYSPGNTDGVLDDPTRAAISQFETDTGMTVTGEPSQAVADALAQAVRR